MLELLDSPTGPEMRIGVVIWTDLSADSDTGSSSSTSLLHRRPAIGILRNRFSGSLRKAVVETRVHP
jgi:hypothetical protein